jgi:hypothetical protein
MHTHPHTTHTDAHTHTQNIEKMCNIKTNYNIELEIKRTS